jgi:hypothetical protein
MKIGENLPIDYLSDHLESFTIGSKFLSGKGFVGIIYFENKHENEVIYFSEVFFPEAQDAFKHATEYLEKNYKNLISQF